MTLEELQSHIAALTVWMASPAYEARQRGVDKAIADAEASILEIFPDKPEMIAHVCALHGQRQALFVSRDEFKVILDNLNAKLSEMTEGATAQEN